MRKIERALISVTDKTGIEDFAGALNTLNIEILSTGGTASKIRAAGVDVTDVSDFTGFPEMLDGRVKTLHPKIHGGILHQRSNERHRNQCNEHDISPIDLVVVNLYAFEKAVADKDCTLANAIENIDIGGPTLLRASAKNFQDVTVVVDPDDYSVVLDEIKQWGNTTLKTRFTLARKVFELTSTYDTAIINWLEKINVDTNTYFSGGK